MHRQDLPERETGRTRGRCCARSGGSDSDRTLGLWAGASRPCVVRLPARSSLMAKRPRRPLSSRDRYRGFVEDYRHGRLDDDRQADGAKRADPTAAPTDDGQPSPATKRSNRRKYVRDYLNWLRPHRYAVGAVFLLALIAGALQMVEPLFMRFIIDRVLLNKGLDAPARLHRLQLAGVAFLAVIIVSNSFGALKDYRQRLLNVGVMLSLRRSLFDRLLHLPLPKLWDMKTGGILSRLTGDIDTTTGLLQMAIVSPSISIIRLVIAVGLLLALNWRLALTALAIIPGVMVVSLVFSIRVRPIYRVVRKDVERIDGRVGETFSGIRVVRSFGREMRELLDYMLGRHVVLRKEMFAQRREMIL